MEKQLQLLEKALILGDQQTAMQPSPTKNIQCNHKIKGTEGLVYYIATTQFLIQDFEGKPVSTANRSTSYSRSKMSVVLHMKVLKGLGNKKQLNTYSKMYQKTSAVD